MQRVFRILGILFITSITIAGCGGGGGVQSDPDISYSGKTTPAAVSGTNANELAGTALYGTTGSDSFILNVAPGNNAAEKAGVKPIKLAKTLTTAARNIDFSKAPVSTISGAVQTEKDSMPGTCGGSASFNISVDDVTGEFSGSMTFSNYNECDGEVLSGPVTFSGRLNLSTLDFVEFTFNFKKLSNTSSLGKETLSGTLSINTISPSNYLVTMNMVYQVNSSKTYKLANYVVSLNESGDPAIVNISGRAYHPDHGYVNITTLTPLQIWSFNDYPHVGVVELSGANGSKATVTFTSNNTYTIEVDANGDGSAETVLGCSWDPDVCM